MRKRLVFATLGLAALAFALAPSSARADHCRSGGYGYGSYGGYGGYGGIRAVPSYRISPGYGYGSSFGRRGVGGYYRGHGHHHHHHQGFYGNRGFGRGYGSSLYLRSPGFSFGIYR